MVKCHIFYSKNFFILIKFDDLVDCRSVAKFKVEGAFHEIGQTNLSFCPPKWRSKVIRKARYDLGNDLNMINLHLDLNNAI